MLALYGFFWCLINYKLLWFWYLRATAKSYRKIGESIIDHSTPDSITLRNHEGLTTYSWQEVFSKFPEEKENLVVQHELNYL